MGEKNIFCFRVIGNRGLFTIPTSKIGGEKMSYQIPTPQALKGITESIFWKPTIIWEIKRFRVINQIQTEVVGIKTLKYNDNKNDLSYYTYLKNLEYEVEVNFKWNFNRKELEKDRNSNKYYHMMKRAIEKGGRRDIFLGTRECQGYIEPCVFGEKYSVYDEIDEIAFGMQFHSFDYPSEGENRDKLIANFWYPVMKKGIIEIEDSKNLKLKREVRDYNIKKFEEGLNMKGIDEELKQNELD